MVLPEFVVPFILSAATFFAILVFDVICNYRHSPPTEWMSVVWVAGRLALGARLMGMAMDDCLKRCEDVLRYGVFIASVILAINAIGAFALLMKNPQVDPNDPLPPALRE